MRAKVLPDDQSARAARSAASAARTLEQEVGRLRRELDPAEEARIERRLASLGSGDEDLRRLFEGQQAMIRRLEERVREKEARREAVAAQLGSLWIQMVQLDAHISRGGSSDPGLTSSIRELIVHLSRLGETLGEGDRQTEHVDAS